MKTIVLTRPMRFAMDEATRLEIAEQMLVVKNKLPSVPSETANLRVKKYVIHVNGTRPEARESTAKRRQILRSMTREAGERVGQIDFWIDGNGFTLLCCDCVLSSLSSERRPSASISVSSMEALR